MIRTFLKYSLLLLLLVLLQVFLFNNIKMGGLINPYFYILFVMLLPFNTPNWLLLLSGFMLGIIIDLFSGTPGLNAFSCVLTAFLRPPVLKLISTREEYDPSKLPRMSQFGISWFVKYTVILVAIHHFTLFYLEVFSFNDFFYTFLRAFLSAALTIILIVFSQLFFYKR